MLIYKEHLPKDTLDVRKVRLPFRSAEDARKAVLDIQLQHGSPCMWYQADYDSECFDSDETKEYLLMAIGTGHHWSDDARIRNDRPYSRQCSLADADSCHLTDGDTHWQGRHATF